MKLLRFLSTLLIGFLALNCFADIQSDKAMSIIRRNTDKYISADFRAPTEQEAYEGALREMTEKVRAYLMSKHPQKPAPDAATLRGFSTMYQRISSNIDDNRYRIMLYVEKDKLSANAPATETSTASSTASLTDCNTTADVEPTVIKLLPDTAVVETKIQLNPTLRKIANIQTRAELTNQLQTLRKDNTISGAAAFPISKINNFYLAVLEGDTVVAVVQVNNSRYIDLNTGKPVEIESYSNCSAYWFTLPNSSK